MGGIGGLAGWVDGGGDASVFHIISVVDEKLEGLEKGGFTSVEIATQIECLLSHKP